MPGELQYITIDDFKPGIQHRTAGVGDSTKAPPGSADPANTFRCRALPWGGLGPMPSLQQTKTRNLSTSPLYEDKQRIVGLHVTGPMQAHTYGSDFTGIDRIELHIVYEYVKESDDSHHFEWERHKIWRSDELTNSIYSTVITHPGSFNLLYHPASLVDARLHATDPTALGDLFVACGWHPDDMDSPDNVWRLYPDPAAPSADGTASILTVNESTIIVQHQGRIISIDNHVFNHGGEGNWIVNDQLVWTQVNLPTVEENPPGTILGVGVFTQGPISGYGAVQSASAQELLLVKHRGGATTISGDIDDPTVFSLPGVTSTGGAVTFGCYTPAGFVYGVRNGGVHVWGGGDSSKKLSINLEDNFWEMKPADWVDFDGKFEMVGDLLMCPNNWAYDFLTESWWRIEDPDTYQIFQWASAPQSSFFFGVPVDFVDGGPIYYRFDYSIPVSDYVWQSQYIPGTIDRLLDIREIRLRALSPNGASTVTVTLTNDAGESVSEEFDIESTTIPKLLRLPTKFQGTGIKVKLEAVTNPDDAGAASAPVIYEVHLGVQQAQREAVA